VTCPGSERTQIAKHKASGNACNEISVAFLGLNPLLAKRTILHEWSSPQLVYWPPSS